AAKSDIDAEFEHSLHRRDTIAGIGIAGRIRDNASPRLGDTLYFIALEMNTVDQDPIIDQEAKLEEIIDVAAAGCMGKFFDREPRCARGAVVCNFEISLFGKLYSGKDQVIGSRVVKHPIGASFKGEPHMNNPTCAVPAVNNRLSECDFIFQG